MVELKKYFCRKEKPKPSLNLQEIIKPLYMVSSLLGLFPYSVTFVKSKQTFTTVRKSIYVNSLSAFTICLILFLFTGLHVKAVLLSQEQFDLTEETLTQMNYIFELIVLVAVCVVAYVCAFLNRIKFVRMLNHIVSSWNEFPTNDNNHRILTYLQFQVNVICLTTLGFVLITHACVNFTRANSLWKIFLVTFTFDLCQMIQFVTLSVYYMFVMTVIALMMNIEWHCRCLQKGNQNSTNDFVEVQNKAILTIKQMKAIYLKVFEIKSHINEAFQGPILATTLQCFHSMVSEAHIVYHGLVVQNNITTHEVINCCIWISYQILKISSVAYSGHILKLQALKIGQTLHSIPTEKRDSRWLMETQHFSSLMQYHDIELNVYGFFPLNATLMYHMVASVTMYLIILVQFEKQNQNN